MIVIGLTGSIGMGKTEAGRYFRKKKIDVFDCDKEIALLYKKKAVLKEIKSFFPSTFINNSFDKQALAKIVFKDANKLKKLEFILYKKLKKITSLWIRKKVGEKKKIIVLDVPLLFETNNLKKYDISIVVSCSEEIQRRRVLKRKNWNKERLEDVKSNQIADEKKRKLADFVIKTDRGKRYLYQQILSILNNINIIHDRSINNILKEF